VNWLGSPPHPDLLPEGRRKKFYCQVFAKRLKQTQSTETWFFRAISIPVHNFPAHKEWGEDVYVIPEYSFCVDVRTRDLFLSHEHIEIRSLPYEEGNQLLTWDSNKAALWEVNQRILSRSKTFFAGKNTL
jgi:hypothetical protein